MLALLLPALLLLLWRRAARDESGAGGRGVRAAAPDQPAEALSRGPAAAPPPEDAQDAQTEGAEQHEGEYEEAEHADGPGSATAGAGSNAAFAALISWPALPSFAPLIEGSVLLPTGRGQGRGTHGAAGQRERAIIVLQWDPVDGAVGLSLSAWPQPSAADRAALGVALGACGRPCGGDRGSGGGGGDDDQGNGHRREHEHDHERDRDHDRESDLVERWLADAQVQLMVGARVDGGADPHGGARWFLLLPATERAEAQAACLAGRDAGDDEPLPVRALEAKALRGAARGTASAAAAFAFATGTDLGLLLRAAARCGALRRCGARLLRGNMRWGQGDLEADVASGRFWPCEGVAAAALALPDATRAHALLVDSTAALDADEPVRQCRAELAALASG